MSALPAPEEKAVAVKRMFDRLAPGYDRMNRLMTARMDSGWRESLVERLRVEDGDRLLDLACGTGDFAALARERTPNVVALDFSGEMLRAARGRDLFPVELVQGDALRLPLSNGSMSVAVCGFALRNFVAIPPVLAELARVLEPGGRLGLLEIDRPTNPAVRMAHALYFERLVPRLGGLVSGDRRAYQYLPQSAAYLPEKRELAAMLHAAGFRQLRKRTHAFGAAQSITAIRA